MFGLIKLIFGLGFLALVFGVGYFWGSQQSLSVQGTVNNMRSELTTQIGTLEQGLHRIRMRLELMNARNHLVAAQQAVESRNFGQARKELENARQIILQAAGSYDPSQEQELKVLAAAVQDIEKQVNKPHPPDKLGVEEAIRALDKFLS